MLNNACDLRDFFVTYGHVIYGTKSKGPKLEKYSDLGGDFLQAYDLYLSEIVYEVGTHRLFRVCHKKTFCSFYVTYGHVFQGTFIF